MQWFSWEEGKVDEDVFSLNSTPSFGIYALYRKNEYFVGFWSWTSHITK